MKEIPKCEKCNDNKITVAFLYYDKLKYRWFQKNLCDACAEAEVAKYRARNIPCKIKDLDLRAESEKVTFS